MATVRLRCTAAIEAKILNRYIICSDVNDKAIERTKASLNFEVDIIIKWQFNCKATGFWVKKSQESNFLLIMHEHLFVFQKT